MPKSTKKPTPLPDSKIDWQAIRVKFETTQLSFRQLADEFSSAGYIPLHHARILRRARKENWQRDHTESIRIQTENALLSRGGRTDCRTGCATPTREDIEGAVRSNVEIILGHRSIIGKGKRSIDNQLDALEAITKWIAGCVQAPVLNEAGEEETDQAEITKAVKARISLLSATSLASQRLTACIARIISADRLSHNLVRLPPELDPDQGDDGGDKGWTAIPDMPRDLEGFQATMIQHLEWYRKQKGGTP